MSSPGALKGSPPVSPGSELGLGVAGFGIRAANESRTASNHAEVKESYRPDELTAAFFEAALDSALQPRSRGVVLWSWPPLAEQGAKQEILERRGC